MQLSYRAFPASVTGKLEAESLCLRSSGDTQFR